VISIRPGLPLRAGLKRPNSWRGRRRHVKANPCRRTWWVGRPQLRHISGWRRAVTASS